MVSFSRTRCRAAAILFLVVVSAVGSSSSIIRLIGRTLGTVRKVPVSVTNYGSDLRLVTRGSVNQAGHLTGDIGDQGLALAARPRVDGEVSKWNHLRQSRGGKDTAEGIQESTLTLADLATQIEDSNGSEKEETFRAKDLLKPITESASHLAQLMSLSMQNLDTFRGTLENQSSIVQYAQSFNATLLQISQKINNTFQNSTINVKRIKLHSLFMSSKVKEATGYLEKFDNSSRMAELLYLSLKNLKETTDQTFNLSSQIANYFGELVPLVDEAIQSHNSTKSAKGQQVRNTAAELRREYEEKMRTDMEIFLIEKEIENLKRQKQLDAAELDKAMDNLNNLQSREFDESQCYWKYNWRTARRDIWYCPPPPYKPDPYQIRQVDRIAREAKRKLEKTMRSIFAEEEEATKKREVNIRIERLNHELHQLREDEWLLRIHSITPLRSLRKSLQKLEKSWTKFVTICGNLQSGATKSLNIVEEANRTSANNLNNNELSESILFNLRKTEEDLSLIEIVADTYLEESNKHITEIVSEVKQMMT